MVKPKILWFATRFPYPCIGGDLLTTYMHLKALSEWADVYLFSLDDNNNFSNDYNKKLIQETKIKDSFCYKLSKKRAVFNSTKTVFNNIPAQCFYYWDKTAFDLFSEKVKKITPQIIIFQTVRTYFYFKNINHERKISFLADAISYNYNSALPYVDFKTKFIYRNELRKLLFVEKEMIENAAASIFVSKRDVDWEAKKGININNSFIVPNGVDLDNFTYKKPNLNSNYVSFFGNMRTVANNDAALFLIEYIFPKLKNEIPNLKIRIAGINPSKALRKYHDEKDILITGEIPVMKTILYDSKLIVSPLRIGAGMQNKILEAAACGVPQVVSNLAYEGLEYFERNTDIFVEKCEQMPKKIMEIFYDKELLTKLSFNARKIVEKNYKWENSYNKMKNVLLKIL